MKFTLAWLDLWIRDGLFGFGVFTLTAENWVRSFLSIYWNEGELLIDICWFRVYTNFPFFYWKFIYKDKE